LVAAKQKIKDGIALLEKKLLSTNSRNGSVQFVYS
jgi:hypothetical protein